MIGSSFLCGVEKRSGNVSNARQFISDGPNQLIDCVVSQISVTLYFMIDV